MNKMQENLINLYGMDLLEKVFINGSMNIGHLKTTTANDIEIDPYFSQVKINNLVVSLN